MSIRRLTTLTGALLLALTLASAVPGARTSSAFPVTLTTPAGTVTLAAQPTRIVSLSSTATEDLFDIGAGAQVVAVDSQSLIPKRAPHTHLSAFTPNAEAIAGYHPDLIVLAFNQNNIVAALKTLHIPVMIEPPAANLNGVYQQLEQLAQATGHLPQAKALVSRLRARVAAIVRSVPHANPTISVYHEIDQNFYSATSHTFVGSIYTLLGLRDIADPAGKLTAYPKLSQEYIVNADPSLIVLADSTCCGQSLATVARRPGWGGISAVVHHQVIAVPDIEASYWGPQIVDFMQTIADHLKAIVRRD